MNRLLLVNTMAHMEFVCRRAGDKFVIEYGPVGSRGGCDGFSLSRVEAGELANYINRELVKMEKKRHAG